MNKQKIENCEKYFIFKIQDLLNNSFHTFEEKRMESLSQYLSLCITTYEEYHMSIDRDKLKKSFIGLIEGLQFQMCNHPYRKLELYKNDFAHLQGLISLNEQQREKQLHNIYRNIDSLKKKLDSAPIIETYIECINDTEDYREMDCLIETFISDLLNKGYSLAFLGNWFKKFQESYLLSRDIDDVINDLKKLDSEKCHYNIYIKFSISSDTQTNSAIELLKRDFTIGSIKDMEGTFLWEGDEYYIAQKEYDAMDEIKAVDMAEGEFASIKELFDMWQGTNGCIKDDPKYRCVAPDREEYIDVRKITNIKMLNYIDDSYKKQMARFLTLRDTLNNNEIRTMERILYTLNNAKKYKIQNRFLNFWSALEYTLYSFPRVSIIEKARVVVPESFALFYIKNKMNIFWKRLMHYTKNRKDEKKYGEILKFVDECRDDNDFITRKVVEIFLDDERTRAINEQFNDHIVLQREFMELHMLINDREKAKKEISRYYEGVKHDLNYIYRIRNQLIHSTKDINEYLEFVSMRLYRYVNALISTILYYEEKNSSYSIIDILCSIDATYSSYLVDSNKRSNSLEDAHKMVRPKYLFME